MSMDTPEDVVVPVTLPPSPCPPSSLSALQADYERTGLTWGFTVQEWESARGLPPYSVYPGATGCTMSRI